MHGQGFTGRIRVAAGGYAQLASCDVVMVSAGVAQKPGETRLDLLNNNARVFRSIAEELDRHAPEALIVVASNPVDILTYMMQELSRRPKEKVIGTGTMLDTSRFRTLLGEYYDVNPSFGARIYPGRARRLRVRGLEHRHDWRHATLEQHDSGQALRSRSHAGVV